MSYRRGFKAYAKRIALEARAEIGVEPAERFDPNALAAFWGIPVIRLSDMHPKSGLLGEFKAEFSAMTVFKGYSRIIVHNDSHALVRQNSNLAHELAHALLQHKPGVALNVLGCREYDDEVELEANYLGACLLLTDHAAYVAVRRGLDERQVGERYAISSHLARFRINDSGARIRARRARQRYV